MANYYGTARSNYFAVKDIEKFKEEMGKIPSIEIFDGDGDNEGKVGFASNCPDTGCFVTSRWDEDTGEDVEVDYEAIIAPHLLDGEVVVMIQAGAEKQRYVSGWSKAFDNSGEVVEIALDNIYELAKKKFNAKDVTLAEY